MFYNNIYYCLKLPLLESITILLIIHLFETIWLFKSITTSCFIVKNNFCSKLSLIESITTFFKNYFIDWNYDCSKPSLTFFSMKRGLKLRFYVNFFFFCFNLSLYFDANFAWNYNYLNLSLLLNKYNCKLINFKLMNWKLIKIWIINFKNMIIFK